MRWPLLLALSGCAHPPSSTQAQTTSDVTALTVDTIGLGVDIVQAVMAYAPPQSIAVALPDGGALVVFPDGGMFHLAAPSSLTVPQMLTADGG
jgi:hypothetical protein